MSERLDRVAQKLARVVIPDKTLDAVERTMRATDNQGNIIISGRDFIPLRSPDGTIWRVRVANDGTLYTAEAPATA